MAHPLDGCRAKLKRAEEVFDELSGSLLRFLESRPYISEGGFDLASSEWVLRFRVRESPPLRWGVLIGDVVHNMRSALDHLAWQLVLLNAAQPTTRTQFPIYGDEAAYRRESAQQVVDGISDDDKAAIEELQPFRHPRGADKPHHLSVLQELSNVDKHRVVHTTLVQTAGSQFRIYGLEDVSGIRDLRPQFGVLEDGAEIVRIGVVAAGASPRLQVDAELDLDVVFADDESAVYDESVLGVLLELREYVGAIIDRFAPRFA
jgi:hypothetical protein